jgi:DNA repair protein RecN (Recombination protein N)
MLSRLQISNYAIINELSTPFTKGLNIITGETGAGKSIVAGALALILGDRADSSVLLDKSRKCIVEGIFIDHNEEAVKQYFFENDIETDQEIILRREISANGKSRAFINDTPVNLSQMQKLASLLVDLHRQFDARELGEDHFQLQVLDALAGQVEIRKEYNRAFNAYSKSKQQEEFLQKQKADALKEYDYHLFLFNELEEASFKEDEIEELEAELNILSHAEQVNAALSKTETSLDGDEQSMARDLKSLVQTLESVAKYSADIQVLVDRLRSAQIEIRDIAGEAASVSASVNMDEKRLNTVQDRLSLGYKLLKKHNVTETKQLLSIQQNLQVKISKVLDLDGDIEKIAKEVKKNDEVTTKIANTLTAGRRKVIPELEKKISALLTRVGMANARLRIQIETVSKSGSGGDEVDFLFDANKSDKFESLGSVASGGELSRLLLCVKTLVAGSLQMPVLIFDEIDSGISGEAARQVGILMKEMGKKHQVISITHQPQIAAMADNHFFVYKKEIGGSLRTQMKQLNEDERVEAIARMMTGEKLSSAALQNARELISSH